MVNKYKLYRRGARYYSEERATGRRKSLKTSDPQQANQLIVTMNSRSDIAAFNRQLAEVHLSLSDERALSRRWQDVMDSYSRVGGEGTQERKRRAYGAPIFDALRAKELITTFSDDFEEILSQGKISISNYLRQLQNYSQKMGWLLRPISPVVAFAARSKPRKRRSISLEEHQKIIRAEGNIERRCYYEMLWLTGAAQSDGAYLRTECFDLKSGELRFKRVKTGQNCGLQIGNSMKAILRHLPKEGDLFPSVKKGDWRYRAAEFARRCRTVGVKGVSLHSYRYSWIERAFEAGIPERAAMAAVGHGSRSIHRIYARAANPVCPSLE